ncbi:hypothetical protein GmHk_U059729 [Glycine max]|nr:hypothetical protein GmHk_U059729 [Glycine max]
MRSASTNRNTQTQRNQRHHMNSNPMTARVTTVTANSSATTALAPHTSDDGISHQGTTHASTTNHAHNERTVKAEAAATATVYDSNVTDETRKYAHFHFQTCEKFFELLDAIVEEVGEENVVQVVTDNGSNYVLGDIGKLPLIRKTIRRAINLVRFIYAHSSTLSLLRNRTNKMELVRYAITRFATSYLTLEMLHKKKANIRKIFISDEWILNKLSKEPKGKEVAKVVLMPSFWNSVVYTLKVMAPLVKVFVFVHFLNPEFFYDNTDLEFDFEVTNDLFDCIKKLVPQFDGQQKLLPDDKYKYYTIFFYILIILSYALGWYCSILVATKLANKILSLTCSVSGCERNWSVFEQIHSIKRNRLEHKRLHDLVFVKYNQQLKQRYNARDEIDPISLNDIDVCNEWVVGEMDEDDDNDAGNDLVFEDDDALNWTTVYEASGVGECRMYTRWKKRERKQPTSAAISPTAAVAAHTSKKQAMGVGSSSRKQNVVEENDEDLEFGDIELESEEEEIMVNFEASNGEEGEGDVPLPYDNNEDDYVGVGEDD